MRKQTCIAFVLLLLFQTALLANHVDEYISQYQQIAIREMQRSGIPASITLGQGIIESAWGGGELARNSNNHFGIKCKKYWQGPTYYIEDDDYENGELVKSCFRAYDNPEDSYIDHTNFLIENERYRQLFGYDPTDYHNWAKGLKACGYATDPHYAEKLINTIEKYGLQQFDQMAVPVAAAPKYDIPAAVNVNLMVSNDSQYSQHETTASVNLVINQAQSVEEAPTAFEIPTDYERRSNIVNVSPASEVETEVASAFVAEEVAVNMTTEYEYETSAPIAVENTPQARPVTPPNREAVIVVSHTGSSRMQHLGRKPRSTVRLR